MDINFGDSVIPNLREIATAMDPRLTVENEMHLESIYVRTKLIQFWADKTGDCDIRWDVLVKGGHKIRYATEMAFTDSDRRVTVIPVVSVSQLPVKG